MFRNAFMQYGQWYPPRETILVGSNMTYRLCVKTDEERFIDDADAMLFRAVKRYAFGVPVIVVGTMKDHILNRFRGEVGPMLEEEHYSDREAKKKELEVGVQGKFVERQAAFAEGWQGINPSRLEYTAKGKTGIFNILAQTFFANAVCR